MEKPLYKIRVFDNTVPYDIHKDAYDYLQTKRWYGGHRDLPHLDRVPADNPDVDVHPPVAHHTISRAVFAAKEEDLLLHPPIQALFDHINKHVFDGKLKLNGLRESSPGINYPERGLLHYGQDAQLTSTVQFRDDSKPWTIDAADNGSIAYLQTHPYETVRTTRIPHRDWYGLVWKPEWSGEFTMFDDTDETVQGADYKDLSFNRKIAIGWPSSMIDNVPGRIVMQDGRQLHASRAVGENAPEPTLHINFRVTLDKD